MDTNINHAYSPHNGSFLFVYNGDDKPDHKIIEGLYDGTVTVGGLAEAGWFKVGELPDGAPIFGRSRGIEGFTITPPK